MQRSILNGTAHQTLENTTHMGRADEDRVMTVTIVLKPSDQWQNQVDQCLTSDAEYLNYQDLERLAKTDEQRLITIRDYVASHGLEITDLSLALHLIQVSGTVRAMEEAFGVELHDHEIEGAQYTLQVGDIGLKGLNESDVVTVLGLDTRTAAQRPSQDVKMHAVTASKSEPRNPREFADLYGFPNARGKGRKIALIEFGGGYSQEILIEAFQTLINNSPPNFTDKCILGAQNIMYAAGYVEVLLDIQIAGSIAPEADYLVVFAPNQFVSWPHAIDAALQGDPPDAISISWGTDECKWPVATRIAVDNAIKAAAAMGVTVLTTSGDTGVASNGKTASISFPSASQYTLCCGGTYTEINDGSPDQILNEIVWNDSTGATGGGMSQTIKVPDWQQAIAMPQPLQPDGDPGRGVPDISANASGLSGYKILVAPTVWISGSGTSAVAPFFAGLIARLAETRGKPLGYLNRTLYAQSGNHQMFAPIVQGNNSFDGVTGYDAGPNWNACTGLGRPIGAGWVSCFIDN